MGFDPLHLFHCLVHACQDLLDVDAAAVMIADARGSLRTMATTDEDAAFAELLQLPDIAVEYERWPKLVTAMSEADYGSRQAIPVRLHTRPLEALTLLRRSPGCLAEDDVHLAQALADSAALALMHWSAEPEHLGEVITRVQGVIASKAEPEIAKGMVPQYAGATIGEASRLLSSYTSVALTRQHASATAEPSTGAAEPVSELLSGRHPVPSASAWTTPPRTSSAPCRNTGAGGSPSSTAGTWSASSPKPMSPVPLPARRWANRSRPAPPTEGSHGERHESASAFRACGGTASWSSGRPSSCSASCRARRDSRSATVSPASAGWRRMVPSSMR